MMRIRCRRPRCRHGLFALGAWTLMVLSAPAQTLPAALPITDAVQAHAPSLSPLAVGGRLAPRLALFDGGQEAGTHPEANAEPDAGPEAGPKGGHETAPLFTFATPQASPAPALDEPISGRERINWTVASSVGPRSLGVGVLSAAWGVARDSPDEYGANWRGFGKRYAIRLSGVAIGNTIEAGAGALWDEDPRYFRAPATGLWGRVAHAGKATVLARRADGQLRPAYARGLGIVGNNFITNAWRAESDSSTADALTRSAVGITGRFVSNLFEEFWPDIRRRLRREPK